jgi:hypothetical protein
MRYPEIEQRLLRWAQGITAGNGSGYPTMSVIHPEWSPPSPGVMPTLKTAASSDVRQTHRAVLKLSDRLQATLVVHYIKRLPIAEQARALDCEERTIHARVDRAHVLLHQMLVERSLLEVVREAARGFCNMHESG